MRVILDTNVLMSGIFWSGPPYEILELWRDGEISLVLSPEIATEYRDVGKRLNRKYKEIDINDFLNLVVTSAEIYAPPPLPKQVCSDPDDDKFIACGILAGVDYLISGDKGLLAVSGYQNLNIIKPKAFLELF